MYYSKRFFAAAVILLLTLVSLNRGFAQYSESDVTGEINVICVSPDEGNKPIDNVYITLSYMTFTFPDQIAYSHSDGKAFMKAFKKGVVQIRANKWGYQSGVTRNVEISYDEKLSYNVILELKKFGEREHLDDRNFEVTVKGKDKNGNTKELPNASVYSYISSQPEYTNKKGIVNITHKTVIGEEIYIYAIATGYAGKLEKFVVGQSNTTTLTSNNDKGVIILDQMDTQYENFTLKVVVLNSDDDKPVPNAYVELRMHTPYQGKTVWGVATSDNNGEAKFSGVPYSIAQNSPYIAAKKDKFKEKWSDLNSELLENHAETERNFTIYIAPDKTPKGLVSETVQVPNDKPVYVYTSDILDPDATYLIEASGTVSDWDTKKPDGVDPCYCYIKWRCPTPEAWGQLQIDGKSMHQINGSTIPYNSGHTYSVTYKGTGQKMKLNCSDAMGSAGDNSGKFTVKITRQ